MKKDKVCIIGSGNWGSAIATIIGKNVLHHTTYYEPIVHMWVYEELISLPSSSSSSAHLILSKQQQQQQDYKSDDTKHKKYKLTDIINTYHENIKYLPNITLPHNIVATSSISEACYNATILIFVVPHQFLKNILQQIKQNDTQLASNCRAISLIKGLDFDPILKRPKLISQIIQDELNNDTNTNYDQIQQQQHNQVHPTTQLKHNNNNSNNSEQRRSRSRRRIISCGVLMGANIANEVAQQKHVCESTLSCNFDNDDDYHDNHDSNNNIILSFNERTRLLFHNEQCFRVQHTTDIIGSEICGAIKNCIALGAGYIDGIQYGSNTKAALLRVGLYEIYQFATYFFPITNNNNNNNNTSSSVQYTTMMESCGIADLITTCYSGRNRLCAEVFAKECIARTNPTTKHKQQEQQQQHTQYKSCIEHWVDIEQRLLHGQKIQGVSTINEVYHALMAHDQIQYFPLLTQIYQVTFGHEPISSIVDGIRIVVNNNEKNSTGNVLLHQQRSFL